jgi:hypothetical protein
MKINTIDLPCEGKVREVPIIADATRVIQMPLLAALGSPSKKDVRTNIDPNPKMSPVIRIRMMIETVSIVGLILSMHSYYSGDMKNDSMLEYLFLEIAILLCPVDVLNCSCYISAL